MSAFTLPSARRHPQWRRLRGTLRNTAQLDYSIIVSPLQQTVRRRQYIAPYAGAAIGEYFMSQAAMSSYDDTIWARGRYRTLSLLLKPLARP